MTSLNPESDCEMEGKNEQSAMSTVKPLSLKTGQILLQDKKEAELNPIEVDQDPMECMEKIGEE
jgi:hypothetical protein